MTVASGKTLAVIGAGIIGLAQARALQKAGYTVLLFDGAEPGMGASFGNAGYIAADEIIPLSHGISPLAVGKMLLNPLAPLAIRWQQIFSLLPWFWMFLTANRPGRAAGSAEALTVLQKNALEAWNTLIREDKLARLFRKNGALLVFESERGFQQEAQKFPYLEENGVDFNVIEGSQAREIAPELSQTVKKGVFYRNGAHVIDPHAVCSEIFRNFLNSGGKFVNQAVTGVSPEAGPVEWLTTGMETHRIDGAVVSAGYQSGEILRPLGFRVPLVAERGYHVVHNHKPLGFDLTIGSHERGFFITPMADGLRLAGTVEFSPAGKNPPPNWKRADILVTHTRELLPGVLTGGKSRWMGHRPTLPDFLPVLGQDKARPNLFFNFGHQHLGLTLAPVSARVMTYLISTGKSPIDLTPFGIARF